MSDNDNSIHTRQRGGSTVGKPIAPVRPAPILPPPTNPAPQKPSVSPPPNHPPKPNTPAPVLTPNKTLQPAGTSKTPPVSQPVPVTSISPLPSRARPHASLSITKPPATHLRNQPSMDIPPPPPEEDELLNVSTNTNNESEILKQRLSTGALVKAPREWQQRWVSLQGRHILAGKKGCEHPIDIPVKGSTVVSDASDLKQPRFAVVSANGQLCYYFLSLSQGDRTQWLTHLIEQGATVITPAIVDSRNEVDTKGWLKVLSPVGANPPELSYLDKHVQRILEGNNMKRESESLKLEALANNFTEIELNKIKMKVSKLEADNSHMTTKLAKQKKQIAELEAKNAMLLQSGSPKEVTLRPSVSAGTPTRRQTADDDGRDPGLMRTISDLTAANVKLHAELEALRSQAAQDISTKQMLTTERDEALDLVEMVEKAKFDMEQAAEELLAQLTREKQDCEKALRQTREDLNNLQQKQADEAHRLRKAEEALTAQASFEASAEELMAELTKGKQLSDEKLRRAEETIQRQATALSLPASTRQSILISPLQQAQASAAELELMAEKMALLDEMCIQKEEYDELKEAYDALLSNKAEEPVEGKAEEKAEGKTEVKAESERGDVNAVQGSQDLAAKWKAKLDQARLAKEEPSKQLGLAVRPPGPPVAVRPLYTPSVPAATMSSTRAPSASLTNVTREVVRPLSRSPPEVRGKPLDVTSSFTSSRTPSPVAEPVAVRPSVSPGTPRASRTLPARNTSVTENRTRGKT